MDGAAGAEVQRARAAWRPYANFPRAFSRHHCVPRENKTIFGILATRASRNGVAWLEVIAQTQLKLKSLRSNRRAQANRHQFDRKNETGKKNRKIFRFSSVNFDRFHRKRPLFGTVLPGPALYRNQEVCRIWALSPYRLLQAMSYAGAHCSETRMTVVCILPRPKKH